MGISLSQYFKAKHEAGITQSRAIQVYAHTQARLRNLRRATKDAPLAPEETWKHHFPGGVTKSQIARGVLAPQYEAMVNARRAAEGLDPNFKEEALHRGASAAHPAFPAEMAMHKTKGTEYLRFMPMTDESGKKLEDAAEYYRGDTGAKIEGDELELLQKFLRPEGSRSKQAGLFKNGSGEWEYAGDLKHPVGFRTFGGANIKAIREEGESDWTQISSSAVMEGFQPGGSSGGSGGPPSDAEGQSLFEELGGMPAPEVSVGDGGSSGSGGGGGESGGGDPEDSDKATNRGNASRVYRDLGSAFGTAIGLGLGGGPIGGAVGSTIGGTLGSIAGGGSVSEAAAGAAKSAMTIGGQAVAGKAGAAIGNALGGVLGQATGGSGRGGHSSGASHAGGGGGGGSSQDEVVYWLRLIAGYLRSIDEGINRRGNSGSHI